MRPLLSSSLPLLLGGVGLAAALGGGAYWAGTHPAAAPALAAVNHYLSSSRLAKSGFFAAFRCGCVHLQLGAAVLAVGGSLTRNAVPHRTATSSYPSNDPTHSMIFLSEMGDKTFFIAALLAMRMGKWISFVGSTAALSAMTVSTHVGGCMGRAGAEWEVARLNACTPLGTTTLHMRSSALWPVEAELYPPQPRLSYTQPNPSPAPQ